MTIVSPLLTFPPISWWMQTLHAGTVILDSGEHFQKMSYRNRYRIAGANNPVLLTVPLTNGRDQKAAVKDIAIHNEARWQVQHWRTLVSVYRRSPYFEHYEPALQSLFERPYTHLADLNMATIEWVMQQLKLSFELHVASTYIKHHGKDVTDLRSEAPPMKTPTYYQMFAERIGFQPDLSILDLLFSEGPNTVNMLSAKG